jgi:hypothetical protein
VAAVMVRTAKDAAEALVRALGLSFGEFSIRVADGKITSLIRRVDSLRPEDLDQLPIEKS